MDNFNSAINRIKQLECPTGELQSRVAGILEDYHIANRNEITINRDEQLDKEGAQAYITKISSNTDQSFVILAKSGLDDYVTKVVNVYTN